MEELVRLQKVVADRGFCSRRKAEEYILEGKVKVNGEVVTALGCKVDPNAKIEVIGIDVNEVKNNKRTYVFNKPLGVVTTTKDDRGRPTIIDYFKGVEDRLYPCGRLDVNTAGCLLVTNDGELAQLVTHPSSHLDKCYIVTVNGFVTNEELKRLHDGVYLEDGLTAPAKIMLGKRNQDITIFKIIIHEGRKRQVRRMCEEIGHRVKSLYRESVGPITCVGVQRGEYRLLSDEEVNEIKTLCLEAKKKNIIPEYKKKKTSI